MDKFFSMNSTFSRFMNLLGDLIAVSICWFVCSLPVFTLGAASTAAYYTAAKCIRHKTGRIFPSFFHSFRTNLKQSAIMTLLYGALFPVLLLDCSYFYGSSSFWGLAALAVFYFLILALTGSFVYAFSLLSRFSMKTFPILRMSIILTFRHLLTTVLLLALLALCGAMIWLMPWGVLVFPGAAALTQTFLLEPVLKKYAPVPEEGSEEAQKWYYQ